MTRPSLQHRAEYALTRAAEAALGALSPAASRRFGAALGALVHSPLRIRRDVVGENLRLAFPDADDDWIRKTTREAYRHLGREATAMARLSTLDPRTVAEMVDIPAGDWAAFGEARAEGKGVLLVTGHYGNWEMAAAAIAARGVPIEAIVKRQSNPLVDRRIEEARRALGIEIVDMGRASRRVPRALLANHTVGIVGDQDARHHGVWVPFFGVPASTYRGPAAFALKLGSPLFAAVARRLPDGRYLLSGERIDTRATGDDEADTVRITAAIAAHLEGEIRKDPTQYFWFHKRWKTRPSKELAPSRTGTTLGARE